MSVRKPIFDDVEAWYRETEEMFKNIKAGGNQ